MSTIESTNAAAPSGEVRYLQPIAIDTNNKKKYCRFKKYGIKHIDHKDPEFLLRFFERARQDPSPSLDRNFIEVPA